MFVVTNLCRLAFTSRFSLMRAGAMVSLTLATALVTPLPPHLVLSPSLSIAVSFLVLGGPCRHRACSPELTGLVGAGRGTRGDNGAVEASLGDLQTVSIMCHVDHEMNRKLTMSTSTCLCVLASCTPCIRKAKSTARQNLRWGYRESRRQSGRGSGTRVRIKLVSRVYIYSLSIVRGCQCHSQQRCKLGRIIGSDLRRSRQRELTFWMAIFADIYKWGGKRVSGCLFLLYIYIYTFCPFRKQEHVAVAHPELSSEGYGGAPGQSPASFPNWLSWARGSCPMLLGGAYGEDYSPLSVDGCG